MPWELTTTKIPGKWAADGKPYQTVEWSYRPLLGKRAASATPVEFRDALLAMARGSRAGIEERA